KSRADLCEFNWFLSGDRGYTLGGHRKELVGMDSERLLFIVVGVVVVFAIGQLLIRGGRRFLAGSVPAERASAGPAASLVAALFHILCLGLVALISVLSVGSDPQTRFLVQLGILLVILAGVYGVALVQINRRRDEALAAEAKSPHSGNYGGNEVREPFREPEDSGGLRIRPVDPSAGGPIVGPGGERVGGVTMDFSPDFSLCERGQLAEIERELSGDRRLVAMMEVLGSRRTTAWRRMQCWG